MGEKFEQRATQLGPYPAQLLYQPTTSPQLCLCGTINCSHSTACDGCRHFYYERDMGASMPACKLSKDMCGSCDSFEASDLYLMYRGLFGEER